MVHAPIDIVSDEAFDDWIVRDDNGRELGHYPTREAAELFAEPMVRRCRSDLIIHLPDGRLQRKSFAGGWLDRPLGR